MLPVVAVEVAPADVAVFEADLLDTCNEGLKRARCVLVDAEREAPARGQEPSVVAVAVVSWHSDQEVLIEVGREQRGKPEWVSRTLRFEANDSPRERWRAVGFTTALLVGEEQQPPETPPPSQHALVLGGRLLWGTGLEGGAFRTGAEGRLDVAPWSGPWLLAVAAQYALAREDAADLDVRWFAGSAGVGWALALGDDFGLRVRAELLLENVAAGTTRDGLTDRESRWVPGVRGAFDLTWPQHGRWAVALSGQGFGVESSTPIASEGTRIGEASAVGALLSLGAEYRF